MMTALFVLALVFGFSKVLAVAAQNKDATVTLGKFLFGLFKR